MLATRAKRAWRRVQDSFVRPEPYMSGQEIQMILALLHPSHVMLEWGCGGGDSGMVSARSDSEGDSGDGGANECLRRHTGGLEWVGFLAPFNATFRLETDQA